MDMLAELRDDNKQLRCTLAERLDLITSIPGVGMRTAVAILLRMPEVGRISRGQAAASPGLRLTMTTVETEPAPATSPGAERAYVARCSPQRCRQPSAGMRNSPHSISV